MATPAGLRIVRVLAVSICCVICACGQAAAAKGPGKKAAAPPKEPPMRVYIVRSAAAGCEPGCPEWIAAQGRIDASSLGRFKKVFKELGKRKLPILIHSGGGLAEEGLAIGRLLRGKGIDVAVSKTAFTPCAPEATACRKKEAQKTLRGIADAGFSVCASSCAFILAGGIRRFVGAGSYVGVHRGEMIYTKVLHTYRMTPYRTDDGSVRYRRKLLSEKVVSEKRKETPKKIYDKYEKYFAEMGVGKDIMPLLLATPNSSVHWLTREELRATRMATHRMDGEQLIASATAPDDGWDASVFVRSAPGRGHPSHNCALYLLDCPPEGKSPTPVEPAKPTVPAKIDQGTPPVTTSSAPDCTQSDSGCSKPSTSSQSSGFAPIVPMPGGWSYDCEQSGAKCPWQPELDGPAAKSGTPAR